MVISATYTANLAAFLTVARLDTGTMTLQKTYHTIKRNRDTRLQHATIDTLISSQSDDLYVCMR